ncbi:MAG: MATE family efflux transporter [Bacilli bacterium]|nr:MATE family efflux transporter [Bacilli bacterium]
MENSEAIKKKGLFANLTQMDMTTGRLFWKLILFAIPLALTTMMQLLYTTVDLISVRFGDSVDSAASISANGALINLIVVLFNNIAVGSNVVLASAKGANDQDKATRVLHTSLIFALIAGIFVAILGYFVAPMLLEVMNTEAHLIDKATTYLKIYFMGLPFLMVYNYCAQMLRAQGDARAPFLILAISGLVNVGFDFLFVYAFKMGVAGVAAATIISEAVSAILGILTFLFNKKSYVRLSFGKLRISTDVLWEVLRVGIPAGLQGFFFSLPNVFIQSSLYSVDPGNVDLENGAIASGNIESYLYAGIDAIGMATMSFCAQNYGAKKGNNIKKVFAYGLIWGVIFSLFGLVICLLFHRQLLHLFVESDAAIDSGKERLFVMAYFYPLNALMNISAGALRGCKYSTYPMVNTLITCTLFRIVYLQTLFVYVPFFHTLSWLYALFPITWGLAALVNGVGILIILPKTVNRLNAEADKPLATAENPAEPA